MPYLRAFRVILRQIVRRHVKSPKQKRISSSYRDVKSMAIVYVDTITFRHELLPLPLPLFLFFKIGVARRS